MILLQKSETLWQIVLLWQGQDVLECGLNLPCAEAVVFIPYTAFADRLECHLMPPGRGTGEPRTTQVE